MGRSPPELARKYQKTYREKHPDRIWTSRKRNELRKKFNMTLEEWFDLMELQQHRCAICGQHDDEHWQALHVDHNHKTGQIRGLLCNKCNRGLGFFNDDPDLLKKGLEYLVKADEDFVNAQPPTA